MPKNDLLLKEFKDFLAEKCGELQKYKEGKYDYKIMKWWLKKIDFQKQEILEKLPGEQDVAHVLHEDDIFDCGQTDTKFYFSSKGFNRCLEEVKNIIKKI
jgi:hypothetical protein